MFELILTIQLIVLFFVIAFIIIVWKSKKLRKKITNNKPIIETLYIIASIFTVFSVLIGLSQFYAEQENIRKMESENQRILLEVFNDSINVNLEIANSIEKESEKLSEGYEWPHFRYSTIILKEVILLGKIENVSLRKQLWRIYNSMEQANRILDELPVFIPITKEQCDIYFKLKKERGEQLIKLNTLIKEELLDLKPKIEEQIQSIKK